MKMKIVDNTNDQQYEELANLFDKQVKLLSCGNADCVKLAKTFWINQFLHPEFWIQNDVTFNISDGHKVFDATSVIKDGSKTIKLQVHVEEEK